MKMLKIEKGQTLIEYIMIISFIVVILVMGIPPMRESVASVIERSIQAFRRNDSPSSSSVNHLEPHILKLSFPCFDAIALSNVESVIS